jgi:hypothetical protein
MFSTTNEFAALAERVARGEAGAAPELQRLLKEALRPVVRRALRGGGTTTLDENIRETARRASHGDAQPAGLAAVVGESVAARIVNRLRAGADSVQAGQNTIVV